MLGRGLRLEQSGWLVERPPPATVAPAPRPRDGHLEEILGDAMRFAGEGRTDVTVTCLVHAVHVAYGVRSVPQGLRRQLNEVIRLGGGFA